MTRRKQRRLRVKRNALRRELRVEVMDGWTIPVSIYRRLQRAQDSALHQWRVRKAVEFITQFEPRAVFRVTA